MRFKSIAFIGLGNASGHILTIKFRFVEQWLRHFELKLVDQ